MREWVLVLELLTVGIVVAAGLCWLIELAVNRRRTNRTDVDE